MRSPKIAMKGCETVTQSNTNIWYQGQILLPINALELINIYLLFSNKNIENNNRTSCMYKEHVI